MKNPHAAKRGPRPRVQTNWDYRAACNFIGGGTGTGLLIAAAFLAWFDLPVLASLLIGLTAVGFGLLMVLWEIGRPWRSINVFFNPKTSWMTREGILAMPLFFFGGVGVFFYDNVYQGISIGLATTTVAGIVAAGYLYCQLRMLNASKGIRAWSEPSVRPYMFITGVVEGLGLTLCLPGIGTNLGVWLALAVLLIVRAYLWLAYGQNLHKNNASVGTCKVIDQFGRQYFTAGHLLPIGLLVLAWLTSTLLPAYVAGILASAYGWYAKYTIVNRAAQTWGFAIPRTPVRGGGESLVLGSQQ